LASLEEANSAIFWYFLLIFGLFFVVPLPLENFLLTLLIVLNLFLNYNQKYYYAILLNNI